MKFKVTKSAMFINGKKYVRGDVVELESDYGYGTWLESMPEEKPKRKYTRKPKDEDSREADI